MNECLKCLRPLRSNERLICGGCYLELPSSFRAAWRAAKTEQQKGAVIARVRKHVLKVNARAAEDNADFQLGQQRIKEMEAGQ
jgi:hypothetical protein